MTIHLTSLDTSLGGSRGAGSDQVSGEDGGDHTLRTHWPRAGHNDGGDGGASGAVSVTLPLAGAALALHSWQRGAELIPGGRQALPLCTDHLTEAAVAEVAGVGRGNVIKVLVNLVVVEAFSSVKNWHSGGCVLFLARSMIAVIHSQQETHQGLVSGEAARSLVDIGVNSCGQLTCGNGHTLNLNTSLIKFVSDYGEVSLF